MEDTPQPKIHFLRTKRFWFRRAVPGMLLALWVEGMLFEQYFDFSYTTPTAGSSYSLEIRKGNLRLQWIDWPGVVVKAYFPGWYDFGSHFSWNPGLELFQPMSFRGKKRKEGSVVYTSSSGLAIPLWSPLILWLVIAQLWSRRQKRNQAALK